MTWRKLRPKHKTLMPHTYPLLTSIAASETSIPFPLLSRVHATNVSAAWEDRSRLRPQGENCSGWWLTDLPLWKICESVGMMTFPIYGNIKKCSRPPTKVMGGKMCEWMWMVCAGGRSFFLENIRFAVQHRADFLFLKPLHCDMPSIHTAPFEEIMRFWNPDQPTPTCHHHHYQCFPRPSHAGARWTTPPQTWALALPRIHHTWEHRTS